MYLKNLSIRGFKSFADKTELDFKTGITAVVGPNGSGKSNISDAVRWVLGEQSVKQLRGGKMEDVIFAGTQFRRPVGQASVSLTLDNTCQTLDVPYNEVTVTRRLYRSGESEYLMNNNVVRLRDIHELFMDTGIGREGYSMIGQGKIDAILSGKPEDRRGLVEEAAGITKYKSRKQEGEKKLKNADDNLVRVEDILSTYEERIGPLKADKEKAEIFIDLSAELKDLQVSVILQELTELEEKNADFITNHQQLTKDYETAQNHKREVESAYEKMSEDLDRLSAKKAQTREAFYENKGQADQLASQIALLKEKERSLSERITQARSTQAEVMGQLTEHNQRLEEECVRQQAVAEKASQAQRSYEAQLAEIKELDRALAESEAESRDLKAKEEALREKSRKLDAELSQREVALTVLLTKQDSLKDLNSNYEASLELNRQGLSQLKGELTKALEKKADLKERLEKVDGQVQGYQEETAKLASELEDLRRKVRDAEGRQVFLKNLEDSLEGYAKSVRDLFGYLKRTKSPHLDQAVVLGDVIETQAEYSVAIESALGGYIGNIITATDDQAKALIEILKKNKLGRCTFLPRNVIKASRIRMPVFKKVQVLGFASDLVETDSAYREIIDSVLARTIIVKNMDDAVVAARESGHRIKIVTLAGDIILGGGAMTGGSRRGQSSGVVSRKSEIQTLADTIQEGRISYTKQKADYDELRIKLDERRHHHLELSDEMRTWELEETRLKERIDAFSREVNRIKELMGAQSDTGDSLAEQVKEAKENLQMAQEAIAGGQRKLVDTQGAMTSLRERRRELFRLSDGKKEALADQRVLVTRWETDLATLGQEIERIQAQIEHFNDRLLLLKGELKTGDDQRADYKREWQDQETRQQRHQAEMDILDEALDEQDRREVEIRAQMKEASGRLDTVREEFYRLEKELYKAAMNLEKYETEQKRFLEKLNDDLDLSLAEARDLAKPLESKAASKRRISEIKGKITNLGHVNLAAIEEYAKVSEHYEFLSGQRNDLLRSKEELEKLIFEVTSKMRTLFRENFVILSKNFKDTFRQLFDGGTAELILSDGDVLTGSIDINVQPPGKKLQNINLLSGGEKVLSAIALTFAILRMKPSPFCFLDEIEAALDDANVYRYANFIKEFAKETQFILITHRKGTMEVANTLYGVTMEEKGISKIVSVDLDQSQEEAI